MMSDRRLYQVTGAVEFVHEPKVCPALSGPLEGEVGIQIAIVILVVNDPKSEQLLPKRASF
jgi:hypothetical protein